MTDRGKTSGWRHMTPADLDTVRRIAGAAHADMPERSTVFAERLALFPQGCWMADGGYAIAHPALLGEPPALDTPLGALPDGGDTLHVHDVALLPRAQGRGLGGAVLRAMTALAGRRGWRGCRWWPCMARRRTGRDSVLLPRRPRRCGARIARRRAT